MMKKIADKIVENRKVIFIIYFVLIAISVFGIFKTKVNYDMSKYLPDESDMRKGMDIMTDEFGDMSSITVMFDDLSPSRQLEIKAELEAMENVSGVEYYQDNEAFQKDNHSKYIVSIAEDTYSKTSRNVLDEIKDKYKDEKVYTSGAVCDNKLLISTIVDDIPIISLVAIAIIFIILFLLCDSWIEPFLFMACIGIAVIINMGTNALLPSVSFMTFAVGAMLQLALSMDYSIMLTNRYMQEKRKNPDAEVAMKNALKNAFSSITSSSVTTIAGLLVLLTMSFKIGQDMGLVLAKGVFISLICIFTILPGMVVKMDKLICKTHKKSLNFSVKKLMKFVTKARFVLVPGILIIMVVAFFIKGNLEISFIKMFDNEDQKYIEETFGVENQTIMLYSKDESAEAVMEYIEWLEKQDKVVSVQDYHNTLGMRFTYSELAESLNMDAEQIKGIYMLYEADNPSENDEELRLTYEELLGFVVNYLMDDENYAALIPEEYKEQLKASYTLISEGKKLMSGEEYNRMIITTGYETESEDSFDFINEIQGKASDTFGSSIYFVGDSAMGYEMNEGFSKEMNAVTIFTIVVILIVVLVTFKSIMCSSVLVLLIQGAVYITTAILCLQGITVNYIALILVQCILMGATIDYGILFMSNYRENRIKEEKNKAVITAIDNSLKTILTSSMILIFCCLTVGVLMTQKVISQTCMFIAYGATCAVIIMIFVLPAACVLLDKWIAKKREL